MQRLKALQRIALVYVAVQHAQSLALEEAAASLREAESVIEEQRAQARRSSAGGRVALAAGEHVEWQMHESQRQFTEWNAGGLEGLRRSREALMVKAAEVYREGRMQLEQMENVLHELRAKLELEQAHSAQRESDDRFLARQWWEARHGSSGEETSGDAGVFARQELFNRMIVS